MRPALLILFSAIFLTSMPLSKYGRQHETRRIVRVGPGRPFPTPSKAAAIVKDGDIVGMDAVTYRGDVAVWKANDLVLRGLGNRPHLEAAGANAEGKAIWVIQGNNTTVENVEFSGAKVPDGN